MGSELDRGKRLVAAPRPRRVLSAAVLLLGGIPTMGALGQVGRLRTPSARRATAPTPAPRNVDFAREIQPILGARCGQCHGSAQSQGGLRLDTRDAMLKGGDS